MDKTGNNTQQDTPSGSQAPSNPEPVKFSKAFTPEVDIYIELCNKENKKPTVKGFATHINTDLFSVNAWAYKKKKDDKGNVLEEYARPNFLAAIQKIEKLEKAGQEDKLNEKQELFCQCYATEREFFGNGVQSYIEIYKPDTSKPNWYKSACVSASQLLSNIKVCRRITELLEDGGFNDTNIDKQLEIVIMQNADFSSKVAAIREYNKLRNRVIERMDHTSKGKELKHLTAFNYIAPDKSNGTDNSDNKANV